MDNLTLGLGASGVAGVVVMIVGWFIAKGIHSSCISGGNVITLDIHRVIPTPSTAATVVTSDSIAVEIPVTAAAPAHLPPLHPQHLRIATPKHTPRASKHPTEIII
jgi:hypothetical protein